MPHNSDRPRATFVRPPDHQTRPGLAVFDSLTVGIDDARAAPIGITPRSRFLRLGSIHHFLNADIGLVLTRDAMQGLNHT